MRQLDPQRSAVLPLKNYGNIGFVWNSQNVYRRSSSSALANLRSVVSNPSVKRS
jgi:hypothetical protein